MSFAEMSDWLGSAKLQFGCSAFLPDHVDTINLTPPQRELLASIPDEAFRQTVRDFCVNQQFRRDYWVKGARRLPLAEQVEAIRKLHVQLVTPRADVPTKVNGPLGEVEMAPAVYGPILDQLGDHRPYPIGALESRLKEQRVTLPMLVQAMLVLAGHGHIAPVLEQAQAEARASQSQALNQALLAKASTGSDITFLGSPLVAGGVAVGQLQQLFAHAVAQGRDKPEEWAELAWRSLRAQGRGGKPGEQDEEARRAQLRTHALNFQQKQLPVLKSLRVL